MTHQASEGTWDTIKKTQPFAERGDLLYTKNAHLDTTPIRSFKDRFYWLLRSIAVSVEEIQSQTRGTLTPELVTAILKEMALHTTYADHITLNVGKRRLETVASILLRKAGFYPMDYFLPLDESTGMISLVIGDPRRRLFFALNEGLDGWTDETAARIREFRNILKDAFSRERDIEIPDVAIRKDGSAKTLKITFTHAGKRTVNSVDLSDSRAEKSHITTFAEEFGEGIQHIALETDMIIPHDEFTAQNKKAHAGTISTAQVLYERIRGENLLPLESQEVYRGQAGRRPEDAQEVFQFFTKPLYNGFFFEFINRKSLSRQAPRQGLFVTGTVLKLYQDKERERKGR